MYELIHHLKPPTDYILGLADVPPTSEHGEGQGHRIPAQVGSVALFSAFGGYTENFPPIAQVLCDRLTEISKHPATETAVLLAHGSQSDEDNDYWLSVIKANIERVKADPVVHPSKPSSGQCRTTSRPSNLADHREVSRPSPHYS
jgi:hypothetical protein